MRKFVLPVVALVGAAVVAVAVVVPALAGDGALSPELQNVRAAVARYHSVTQAETDGYSGAGEPCVSSPFGTMGIHFVNGALIADGAIDPLRPEILLYAPKANGELRLVAAEYFKVDADQNLATSGDRPSLFGQPFDGPMPGHNPLMPVHYDLHAWVAEENPSGALSQWNPALSCP